MENIYEPGTILKVFTKFSSIKQDGLRWIKLCLMDFSYLLLIFSLDYSLKQEDDF